MLSAIACGDTAVLEVLTDTSLNTLEQSGTDLKTYTMLRIAALVAMDAAPVSYAITVEAAGEVLTPEDMQSVLVALAPVVGSARIACAASNLLDVYFDEEEDDDYDDDEIGFVEMVVTAEDAAASESTEDSLADEGAEDTLADQGAEDTLVDDERELEAV
jgi:hypothetical protein